MLAVQQDERLILMTDSTVRWLKLELVGCADRDEVQPMTATNVSSTAADDSSAGAKNFSTLALYSLCMHQAYNTLVRDFQRSYPTARF